jgi:hypothetical protein
MPMSFWVSLCPSRNHSWENVGINIDIRPTALPSHSLALHSHKHASTSVSLSLSLSLSLLSIMSIVDTYSSPETQSKQERRSSHARHRRRRPCRPPVPPHANDHDGQPPPPPHSNDYFHTYITKCPLATIYEEGSYSCFFFELCSGNSHTSSSLCNAKVPRQTER